MPVELRQSGVKQATQYQISFHFSLCYINGQPIDNNIDKAPMYFRTGANEMLTALETELIKLEAGERKRIFLSAKNAYGPVQDRQFRSFPLEAIPEEARQIGRKVMAVLPDGSEELVDVVDIQNGQVVLNFNHPLAGKDLRFDVTVVSKKPV